MDLAELREIENPLVAAWNAHDVEAVVACYTDDWMPKALTLERVARETVSSEPAGFHL